jgi:hypothetical protein
MSNPNLINTTSPEFLNALAIFNEYFLGMYNATRYLLDSEYMDDLDEVTLIELTKLCQGYDEHNEKQLSIAEIRLGL